MRGTASLKWFRNCARVSEVLTVYAVIRSYYLISVIV